MISFLNCVSTLERAAGGCLVLEESWVRNKRAKYTPPRRWIPRNVVTVAVIVAVAGLLTWLLSPTYGCLEVNADSKGVLLNIDRLARGSAQKYCWRTPDGTRTVRFIVARRSDDGIAVVLDACRVCYLNSLGYRHTKGGLICRFCGNRYSIDTLSVGRMSCLPFKLPFKTDRQFLRIKTADLESRAGYFPAQPFAGRVLSSAFGWLVGRAGRDQMRMAAAARQ
jgi:uncharacterized membrane protein